MCFQLLGCKSFFLLFNLLVSESIPAIIWRNTFLCSRKPLIRRSARPAGSNRHPFLLHLHGEPRFHWLFRSNLIQPLYADRDSPEGVGLRRAGLCRLGHRLWQEIGRGGYALYYAALPKLDGWPRYVRRQQRHSRQPGRLSSGRDAADKLSHGPPWCAMRTMRATPMTTASVWTETAYSMTDVPRNTDGKYTNKAYQRSD